MNEQRKTRVDADRIFGDMPAQNGPSVACPRGNPSESWAHDYDVADAGEGGPTLMFCGRCGRTYEFELRP